MVRQNFNSVPPPPEPFPAERHLVTTISNSQPSSPPSPNGGGDNNSPGILITVVVLAITVIFSASLYLFIRFLRRRRRSSRFASSPSVHYLNRHSSRGVCPPEKDALIDSLPLFTFDALTGSLAGAGDCAVCLSKFEPKDLLRLLPICCHVFHSECIDTWLAANHSCPLCRSPIFLFDDELLRKFSLPHEDSRSFRVEIGNVSRRNTTGANSGETRRSYSISGSFDYVLDGAPSEVHVGSFRWPSDFKIEPTAPPVEEQAALAAEVGQRGGWLKDYLSHSLVSSRTASFRGSRRWLFTGSGRRSTTEFTVNRESELDLEASQLGEEIGELFRWLSGV